MRFVLYLKAQRESENPMTLSINSANDLQVLSDKHFTTKCPHCNTKSGLSLVSAPRYEYMRRFKSEWVGFVYRCDACDLPPRTSPPSKLDSEPFEVHSKG